MIESIEELQKFLSGLPDGRIVRLSAVTSSGKDRIEYMLAGLLVQFLLQAEVGRELSESAADLREHYGQGCLETPIRMPTGSRNTSIFGKSGLFDGVKPQDAIPRLAEPLRDPELEFLRSKGKA